MTTTLATPLDIKNNPIFAGSIVSIRSENDSFFNNEGIVINTASNLYPNDGPISVFFDREVPKHRFHAHDISDWNGPIPTPENEHLCDRIVCFLPNQLQVIEEFGIENLIRRKFGSQWHHFQALSFSLVPDSHLCQLESCRSGANAKNKSFINVWGTICVVYTCDDCHQKWHGIMCDDFELRNPLPGAPIK